MLVSTRGIGAGRWCWGRFRQHNAAGCEEPLSEREILLMEGADVVHTPGRGDMTFVNVRVCDSPRNYMVCISSYAIARLFRRHTARKNSEFWESLRCRNAAVDEHVLREVTVQNFSEAVRHMLVRKSAALRTASVSYMYSVTPSFYELCKVLCAVECELFADAVNESGVLDRYCSLDPEDTKFGAIGSWESSETGIQGGAGNPPFCASFIANMMSVFDRGVMQNRPYCRIVLLPSGTTYDVSGRCSRGYGSIIMTIPPGNLGMKSQERFLQRCQDIYFPQTLQKQGLFIVLWANSAYWRQHPPPSDAEFVCRAWITYACRSPQMVRVHDNVINSVLPKVHRSTVEHADALVSCFSSATGLQLSKT